MAFGSFKSNLPNPKGYSSGWARFMPEPLPSQNPSFDFSSVSNIVDDISTASGVAHGASDFDNQLFNSNQAQVARDWSAVEAEKARNYNSAEAQKNRDWQERMSNTAYQRAREDMIKAGLNPYLAYGQGGASVGGGATASASNASGYSASYSSTNSGARAFASVASGISSLMNSALSLGRIIGILSKLGL